MAALRLRCKTVKHIGKEDDKNYKYAINKKEKNKAETTLTGVEPANCCFITSLRNHSTIVNIITIYRRHSFISIIY